MAGITGVLSSRADETASRGLVSRMTAALRHRGPDGVGVYAENGVALGHCRAALLDDAEEQPVYASDGSLAVVLDGDIEDCAALGAQLPAGDRSSAPVSPARLLLGLYRMQGPEFLRHVDGVFALAIYDRRRRALLLARDRMGERPLYFTHWDGACYFSSEIKSFWEIPGFRPGLSAPGLLTYFAYTQSVPPYSIYAGVHKLVPGHYVFLYAAAAAPMRPYWRLDYVPKSRSPFTAARAELERLLATALENVVPPGVTAGVALSGGVDSSTVLGLITRAGHRDIKTFTIGNSLRGQAPDPEFGRAQAVARLNSTEHHAYELGGLGFDDFRDAIRSYDEPIGIFDAVHYLRLFDRAKRHSQVVLTGNGADSLFAGSGSYGRYRRRTLLRQAGFRLLPRGKRRIQAYLQERMQRVHRADGASLFAASMERFANEFDVADYLWHYLDLAEYDHLFDANQFFELFVRQTHLLTIDDTVGMASSIRVRTPFFNRRVVELAAALPLAYKVGMFAAERRNKILLRDLAKQYMPRGLVYAKKLNCGNFIDYEQKMRSAWRAEVEALWGAQGTALASILSPAKLTVLWTRFIGGQLSPVEQHTFRKVLVFLVWHEQVFAARTPAPSS